MISTPLLADMERAIELLKQADVSKLNFSPDPVISADIKEFTELEAYPTESHLANLEARLEAVARAGDKLADARAPSEYVSKLIVECARLAPLSD